jgi:phenylpropionate dioxygenase-like ring-hydroxylating dioxygenase large terminal subunit
MDTINGYWYIAAAGSELKEKPIKLKVEGESLVLWRDRAGKPQALRDRCAHRGMALSAGKVVDGCIQCPYHGYTYDGEGRPIRFSSIRAFSGMKTRIRCRRG